MKAARRLVEHPPEPEPEGRVPSAAHALLVEGDPAFAPVGFASRRRRLRVSRRASLASSPLGPSPPAPALAGRHRPGA